MSQIELRDVSYRYPGSDRPALDRVTLEVTPGELVVVAGATGSGKSTLLRAINGLVPHFYGGELAGAVRVAGRSTREHTPGQLAIAVASLFQDPETQIVMGTPRAELAFPLENRGMGPAAIARGVEEAALALAIAPLLDRPTAELSGGELQRVALAATLAGAPEVVCLDEPTSQLDPVAGDELIGVLRRLNEDRELTVILAEHRLERCLPLADRVLAMDRGAVAFDGPPEEFLRWALDAEPALATPGAQLLARLSLTPAAGVRRARAALRDAGHLPAGPAAGPAPAQPASATAAPALRLQGVWHELRGGPAILRGVTLALGPGERVALMGRNGAGKTTLLRHAAGLAQPTRGRIEATGRVALVLQNPSDYLIHETVGEEAPAAALVRFGLEELRDRHPRDLSGGEKQRLALAIVLGDPGAQVASPAVVCMDEPTRGMDRTVKDELAQTLRSLEAAVLVATHDPELAAAFAERVVLLADGRVIADGPAAAILAGGSWFTTETARILGGAGGALLPSEGAALLGGPVMAPPAADRIIAEVMPR